MPQTIGTSIDTMYVIILILFVAFIIWSMAQVIQSMVLRFGRYPSDKIKRHAGNMRWRWLHVGAVVIHVSLFLFVIRLSRLGYPLVILIWLGVIFTHIVATWLYFSYKRTPTPPPEVPVSEAEPEYLELKDGTKLEIIDK